MEEIDETNAIVIETDYNPKPGHYFAALCNGVHPEYSPLPWLASIKKHTEDEFDEAVRQGLAEAKAPPDRPVLIKHYGWETLIECADPSVATPHPELNGPALV